ncbi:MAG: HAD family phosphatase [Patescibacteria group bacterium]
MIKAIIFDMDGVISLTETLQSTAESRVLAKIGINIDPETIVKNYSGYKAEEALKAVLRSYHMKADIQKLLKERWDIVYNELLPQGFSIVRGVKELIEALKSDNYVLAIASAAPLKFIKIVISKLRLAEKFSAITSGDDVKIGKPDPAIFILTAQKLNTKPQDCLVIEDAPAGVLAAKRAKMKCIAITTTHTREELKGADKIIDSFEELDIGGIQNL